MPTLLGINDDMQALDDLLTEAGGDITGIENEVRKWSDELKTNFEEKVDGYAALYQELTARATARKAEADRLARRAEIDKRSAAWLKHTVLYVMREREMTKIETDRFRISVAKNGGKLPLVLDADDVPAPFRRTPPSVPDTDKIREALDMGKQLPFAEYGERGIHLNIR